MIRVWKAIWKTGSHCFRYDYPTPTCKPFCSSFLFCSEGDPALAKNNCLNAAKACNLNDTCKKYRSAYISPCTSRVSTAEVCNKRKCHKALRQFFDKVPLRHSYGMLYCSCPQEDQVACSERRRQTIVPACSYEDKEKPNCLALQLSCKSNYICRYCSYTSFVIIQ